MNKIHRTTDAAIDKAHEHHIAEFAEALAESGKLFYSLKPMER